MIVIGCKKWNVKKKKEKENLVVVFSREVYIQIYKELVYDYMILGFYVKVLFYN